jgi:acyl-CoA thioester hydrolase
VIEAHCEYQRPARYDDELEITARGRILSPVRMEFLYEVKRVADGVVAASGWTKHAALDSNGRPCRLPARVREVFA